MHNQPSSPALTFGPEATDGHLNWRDHDSHFIFGDVAAAILADRVIFFFRANWRENACRVGR